MFATVYIGIVLIFILSLSGSLIGINGMIYILILVLLISPVMSFYILYNMLCMNIYTSNLLYIVSYKFIVYYNYSITFNMGLSILILCVVIMLSCVSYSISLYILLYMYRDKYILRFVSLMLLFTGSMVILIVSYDIVLLFVGWEMIGIMSLLLIGYFNSRISAVKAGLKAVFYNRVGDIFFLLVIVLSLSLYNSNILSLFNILIGYSYNCSLYNIQCLIGTSMIICGWTKSTQLGFQPWLLDAMEGPTPVSSLLHSATLVTAGCILLYKNMYILYYNSSLCLCLIILGCYSLVYNSLSSVSYLDLKRIIAYSTCTHISLIIMVLGCSLYCIFHSNIGMYHLLYHGFCKSLTFMISGYMISIIGSQDLRNYGSLYSCIPVISVYICICLLNIFGLPGSSLSYTKDLIFSFCLLSCYGYGILVIFICVVVLSEGYSLGILLYLLFSYRYSFDNMLSGNILYIFIFFYLICCLVVYMCNLGDSVLLVPLVGLVFNNIVFELISLVGLILCYNRYRTSGNVYVINMHNNRLYIDKILSSVFSIFSIYVVYVYMLVIEYGFIMHYLNILIVCSSLTLVSG